MDIGDSFQRTMDSFFDFLPNLLGFLLILLIGYIVARLVATAVRKVLETTNVDRRLHESAASRMVESVSPKASPTNGVARVVFWLIFIFFVTVAIGALGIPAATGFMNDVLSYLPNVIVAILIFVVAALISGAVASAISRFLGDTPMGKVAATVAPALIMVIAFFMILEQLQIAPEIVRIAFTAIMFALALGLALAFGLGGRELAADALRQARDKGAEARRTQQGAEGGTRRADVGYASTTSSTTTTTTPTGAPGTGEAISSDRGYGTT
jgi:MFS family permease